MSLMFGSANFRFLVQVLNALAFRSVRTSESDGGTANGIGFVSLRSFTEEIGGRIFSRGVDERDIP